MCELHNFICMFSAWYTQHAFRSWLVCNAILIIATQLSRTNQCMDLALTNVLIYVTVHNYLRYCSQNEMGSSVGWALFNKIINGEFHYIQHVDTSHWLHYAKAYQLAVSHSVQQFDNKL